MANGSYELSCVDSEWVEISQTFGTQKWLSSVFPIHSQNIIQQTSTCNEIK